MCEMNRIEEMYLERAIGLFRSRVKHDLMRGPEFLDDFLTFLKQLNIKLVYKEPKDEQS